MRIPPAVIGLVAGVLTFLVVGLFSTINQPAKKAAQAITQPQK